MAIQYDTVVGLEVHIQLNTKSKAFCGDENTFGDAPNTHVSAVSLAHPGTLPVVNELHVLKAVTLGVALGCNISPISYFDRKHYFYPDLPKGYQITQDGLPICTGGYVEIDTDSGPRKIRIHHIHMEEDAGKTIHDADPSHSLVDLNRAGTPLLELVTEPDLISGEEVYQFIGELQKILRFIEVSDADMEKGSMRCDCNVSIKPKGSSVLGERCEIKNLNSKRFARDAVDHESRRQQQILAKGKSVHRQTLHYDSEKKRTQVLRDKEGADDYRYFKDPDIPPVVVHEQMLSSIRDSMPELPRELKRRLMKDYQFTEDYAEQLSQLPENIRLFEALLSSIGDAQSVANFIINLYLPAKTDEITQKALHRLPKSHQEEFIKMILDESILASVANTSLWEAMLNNPDISPIDLAKKLGVVKKSDQSFLDDLVAEVIESHPAQVKQFKSGKKALIGFFMGQVMRRAKGGADPSILQQKLSEALNNS